MKKGGGKAKGSSFERLVCKELSLWVSNGEQKDVFWRSAMSGGRSTVARKKGDKLASQAGDISSVDRLGHVFIDQFVVECKFYKSLNFESFIKGKGKLLEFWRHLVDESASYSKKPMLVGKQNNFPIVVCLDEAGVAFLGVKHFIKVAVLDENLHIMLWDDFLKIQNPFSNKSKRIRL